MSVAEAVETPFEIGPPPPETSPKKWVRWTLISVAALACVAIITFSVAYHKLSKRVDEELAAGLFSNTVSYFSSPQLLSVGDSVTPSDFAADLKRSGLPYKANSGQFVLESDGSLEIQFANGKISSMTTLSNGRHLTQFELPPQLITNLSNEGRAKRVMVQYSEMPPALVHAVISAEDKHFFSHSGFDARRIAKALYVDVKDHRKEQGASTISMQLARNLWLDSHKNWKRKVSEALITLHLESKLSKQQILEHYCNNVYLGGQSTFSIHGFGEAARIYFNTDVQKLSIPEAALLAGLIQRPSRLNPYRYPDRAVTRRNAVLTLMRENKYINEAQWQQATAAPLGLHLGGAALSEAQYFLDMASEESARQLDESQSAGSAQVTTTLDLRLQRAAEQSIADGMQLVDKLLAARRKKGDGSGPVPQVALIALDPHTGEVKALAGGRNYAVSQLNRVLAKRPPGSVFKPFVYAAAMNTAVVGGDPVLTPATMVVDEPTTFAYGNQVYTPANFRGGFMGNVTLRYALAHSLNVATVKVGQMAGFDRVVALAHSAGLNEDIKATPAVALGAYDVTPLEIAGAYTIFANDGIHVEPVLTSDIHDRSGRLLYHHSPANRRVIDPRVAYVMVDMLQEVIRSGTAAGVRAHGFSLPAAGKTGTSHDGWFAGFTSQLLCVVWVGFDDYSELNLEGARSALPIWTEFMTQAARFKQYGDAKPFAPPAGVLRATFDPDSGQSCPGGVASYFVAGSQPTAQCEPRAVELISTADGGFAQRLIPLLLPKP
jgi:penicillin-binding protein 1B